MSSAAIRFETFDPADVAEFGALSQNAALKQACDAAYQQGYRDAESNARKSRTADRDALLARIAERADDFSLSGAEARAAVIKGLKPLINAVIRAALPASAQRGLGREIAAVVSEIAGSDNPANLCIHVAPESVPEIRLILDQSGITTKIAPDQTLMPLQARISAGDGWEQIDLGKAANSARHIVENFFDAVEGDLRDAG